MGSQARCLEIFFFPFVGGGHLIPMIDLARLFSTHGVKSTIITFPNDVAVFQKSINRDQQSGLDINLFILRVPADDDAGLSKIDMSAPPVTDTSALQEPLQQLLKERRPDCIVTDPFHRWVADATDEVEVPRIIFNGNCCFADCCGDSLERHSPHTKVDSDSEPFILPGLPDRIELTRSQLPLGLFRMGNEYSGKNKMVITEHNSFGRVVNSFYELEPAYVDHCRNVIGKKVWLVGPVSLCNKNLEDKAERGQKASIDQQNCLNWLACKNPRSVLYVSFGSLARLSSTQLREIASGLENSGHPFIWVVGKTLDNDNFADFDGFEERMMENKKGLIIKGWAPQLLILEHEAIGGFMTHCGWNSTLEGVCAGVPMITWPLSAEQFSNEKLVTDVLKIGIKVGSEEWASWQAERKVVVGRKKVEAAVARLMSGGEEVVEMRRRVKELAELGRRAVEEGGSSFNDVNLLIEELKFLRPTVEDVAAAAAGQ